MKGRTMGYAHKEIDMYNGERDMDWVSFRRICVLAQVDWSLELDIDDLYMLES